MFFLIFFISFPVAIIFYLKQKPQFKKIVCADEQTLYQESPITVIQKESNKDPIQMAWMCIKITQKRIFFLYPDRQTISKILDFSGDKKIIYETKLKPYVFYFEKAAVHIEQENCEKERYTIKAVGIHGGLTEFRFRLKEKETLNNILGI